MGCITSKCCTDNNIKTQLQLISKITKDIVKYLDENDKSDNIDEAKIIVKQLSSEDVFGQ